MILSARHNWREIPGFTVDRPQGLNNYTFLHFFTNVTLMVNGVYHDLNPGACIIYAPDTPQWYCGKEELLHNWMHLSTSVGEVLEHFNIPVNQVFYLSDSHFISSSVFHIELEINSTNAYRSEMANAEFQQMLIQISRAYYTTDAATSITTETRAAFNHFRLILMWQKNESWTLERMANLMSLSVSRFCAVYKALFGLSPMNDLIQIRIDAAKSLLTGTKISISDLASQLGYSNASHFTRQFKKHTGVSPTEYAATQKSDSST